MENTGALVQGMERRNFKTGGNFQRPPHMVLEWSASSEMLMWCPKLRITWSRSDGTLIASCHAIKPLSRYWGKERIGILT